MINMSKMTCHFRLILAILGVIFCWFSTECKDNSKPAASHPLMTVTATSGLNLRQAPERGSEIIVTIPHNEQVALLDPNGPAEEIEGKSAPWAKVSWKQYQGWAWSGFLTTAGAAELPRVHAGCSDRAAVQDRSTRDLFCSFKKFELSDSIYFISAPPDKCNAWAFVMRHPCHGIE